MSNGHFGWHRLIAGLLGSSILFANTVALADKQPEVLVSEAEIVDFEFDWGRDGVFCPDCNQGTGNARLAFTNRQDELWVAEVDPESGAFVPADGLGTLVDVDAAFAADFGNGPEWVSGEDGSQITYTKYLAGQPRSIEYAGVAMAALTTNGWAAGFVGGEGQRVAPLGSLDLGDPNPRISYKDAVNDVFWRYVDDPLSEEILPKMDNQGASRRWVPDQQATIFTASTQSRFGGPGLQQVFHYDLVTRQLTQLTRDLNSKWGVFMWRAPEFNNEYVFFVLANFNRLLVYRELPNRRGTLRWTVINSIAAPAEYPFIWSPEPFVHNGKSYISMQVSSSPDATDFTVPTHIAITGIDPEEPSFRMLTDATDPERVRLDPEYYITDQGPFIYYNRYVPSTSTTPARPDGVWRVDTGLGPGVGP